VKNGASNLALTADNTYTGGTTVSAGTLIIGGGGTNGSVVGPITNNGTVRFFRSDTFTLANPITGTGSLDVNVAGGLTVDGTAGITIGGTIQVPNSAAGAMAIRPGASISAANLFLGNTNTWPGSVTMDGGSVYIGSGNVRIGHWPSETSTWFMAGGSLTVTNDTATNPFTATPAEQNGALYIGIDGTGLFTMTGGVVRCGGLVLDNRTDTPGTDVFALEGGVCTIGRWGIQGYTSTVVLLGGGTMSAYTNWVSSRPLVLTGTNGPCTFDTAGWTIGLSNVVSGVGGLTKTGAGVLLLQSSNTYAGATTVNAGYLFGTGSVGSAITVNSGGTIGPSPSLVVTGMFTAASLNIGSNAAVSAPLRGTNPTIHVTGDVSNSPGSIVQVIPVAGALTNGTHVVIDYDGAFTGNISDFTLVNFPNGGQGYLTNNLLNTSIDVVITNSGAGIKWDGLVDSTWKHGGPTNWKTIPSASLTTFSEFDSVLFDDSATGTTTVNISEAISPSSINVTNTVKDYVFNGSAIGGNSGLNKDGAGKLTILSANSFTGQTVLAGGAISVNSDASLGTAPATTVSNQLRMSSATTLEILGNTTLAATRGVLIGTAGSAGSVTLSVPSNILATVGGKVATTAAATSGVSKTGSGILALGSSNVFSGTVSVQSGTLRIGAVGALANNNGVTISSGGRVDLNGLPQTNILYSYSIAGSGPDGRGAIVNTNASVFGNSTVRWLALTGDATIGALGNPNTEGNRFDVYNSQGNGFTLTKVGNSSVSMREASTNLQLMISEGFVYTEAVTNGLGTNNIVNSGASLGSYGNVPGRILMNPVVLNGGILASRSGANAGAVTWAGPITLAANSFIATRTLQYTNEEGIIIMGGMSGTNGLTILGNTSNTVFLGASTYTGGTTIHGRLQLGTNGTSGSIVGNIVDNNQLTISRSDFLTLSGDISGTGSVLVAGSGTITIGGTNTYTGTTTLDGGTLVYTADNPAIKGLTFGANAGSTNVVTLDLTAASVVATGFTSQVNSLGTNIILIGAGRSMTISGNVTVGYVSGTTNAVTLLKASGTGGSLFAGSGSGSLSVGDDGSAVGTQRGLLDLSGLGAFTASYNNILIGVGSRSAGAVILAATSTLTASTLTVADNTGNGMTGSLILGQTNTFNIGTLNIGREKTTGAVLAFTNTFANPVLVLNGLGGSATRADMNVASFYPQNASGSGNCNSTADFSGGTVNALLGTLTVGRGQQLSGNSALGALVFSNGTIDATAIVLGSTSGTNAAQATASGTFTMNGGSLTVGAGGMILGLQSNVSVATGIFNLNGGTATLGASITSSNGLGTLTLNGGTLNMQGNNIGGGGGSFVSTLNLQSGTLANVAEINNGAAWSKTSSGTLTLGGTNSFTSPVAVSNGTLLVNGSVSGAGQFTVVSGTLGGMGSIAGSVIQNGGSVSPGISIGTLTILSGYTNTAGSLDIQISGTTPGTGYDVLAVGGAASLTNGMLNVTTNGYAPVVGNTFTVLTASVVSGTFTNVSLPALTSSNSGWSVQYLAGAVVLSVTGAPPLSGYDLASLIITNPADRGFAADPDGDGYANLLEYVTGASMTNFDQIARMSAAITNDSTLELVFTRDTNAIDATLIVEGSYATTNDATWVAVNVNSNGVWNSPATVSETGGPNPVTVTVQDTAPAATNRFLRLHVTRP
jgi:autotransporter-associated beta strand protein